jgi:hypothetical protein
MATAGPTSARRGGEGCALRKSITEKTRKISEIAKPRR